MASVSLDSELIADLYAAAEYDDSLSTTVQHSVSSIGPLPPLKRFTSDDVKSTMAHTVLEEKRKRNHEQREAERKEREIAKRPQTARREEAVSHLRSKERDVKSSTRHRLALEWSASFDNYRTRRHEVRELREKRNIEKLDYEQGEYHRKRISKFLEFERNGRSGIVSDCLSAHSKLNQKIINSQRDLVEIMRERRRRGLYKQRRRKAAREKSEEQNKQFMREEDRSSRFRERAGETLRTELHNLELAEADQRQRVAIDWNRCTVNLKSTLEREGSIILYDDKTNYDAARLKGRCNFLQQSTTLYEKVHKRSVLHLLDKLERETTLVPLPRPTTSPDMPSWYEREEIRLMSDLQEFYSPMKEVSLLSIRKNRMLQTFN